MITQAIGQGASIVGFAGALWQVWYVAGIVVMAASVVGLFLYQAYYPRLQRDNQPEERP